MVFKSIQIGPLSIKNRFVRSATWEGLATDEGAVTPRLTEKMVELAKGEIGLIITGHAFVSPEGKAGPRQLGLYKDDLIDGLKQMVNAVHEAGGKIVAQLAHAGAFSLPSSGLTALSPSGFKNSKPAEKNDIKNIVKSFSDAAIRAQMAGFDGVQIHGAHGYLLSQFLSPYFNKRTDEYGGSLVNRARIIVEILHAIRDKTTSSYPVIIKINSEDFLEGGFSTDEMLEVAEILEHEGLNGIELSGGTIISEKLTPVRIHKKLESSRDVVPYYVESSRKLKGCVRIPVMLVGGIRSYEDSEKIVKDGVADMVSLSRPLIREPHIIKRWKEGDREPSRCLSDNLCFVPAMKGEGLYCVRAVKEGRKHEK